MKRKVFLRYLYHIRLTASGTSLAFASLGNLLGVHAIWLKVVFGGISILTLSLITLKIFFFRREFIDDIKNIQIAGAFPTFFMTLMVLSTYLDVRVHGFNLFMPLWLLGFTGHLTCAVVFLKNHHRRFRVENALPNWFITFVAYAMVGIAAPSFGMQPMGRVFVALGLVCYSVLFPAMLYRVRIVKGIPQYLKPVIWLFNSPINICIVAYMSSYDPVHPVFLLLLFSLSIFSFVFTLMNVGFKQVAKNGFVPAFSAFTFPSVIFVTAFGRVWRYYYDIGWFTVDLTGLTLCLEAVCAVVAIGVLCSYTRYVHRQADRDAVAIMDAPLAAPQAAVEWGRDIR